MKPLFFDVMRKSLGHFNLMQVKLFRNTHITGDLDSNPCGLVACTLVVHVPKFVVGLLCDTGTVKLFDVTI